MPTDPLHIAVLLGTVRPGNYTSKAAALAVDELRGLPNVEVELIDPATLNLTLPGVPPTDGSAETLQATVARAHGVLLVSPEYHGSVSSAMKLVLENLGFPSTLATKPIALLGVAAGVIGAVKSLEQLRSICAHVGAIVLPGSVSVAGVQQVFAEDGTCQDEAVEQRIRAVARGLVEYIRGRS